MPTGEQRLGYALLTQSFTRTLEADETSSLKTDFLPGKALFKDMIDTQAGSVRLVNAYGSAEASVFVATHNIAFSDVFPRTIRYGRKAHLWIINLDNQDCLAGMGWHGLAWAVWVN